MPMTVGGGVTSIEDIRALLAVGADKVAINSAAIETPELIRDGARQFGTQCIVVSIDVQRASDGEAQVVSRCGKFPTGRDPVSWAKEVEALGAGEILLTSIERDGAMTGYDVSLVKDVSAAVKIPVIASGGCGNYEHMAEVLSGSQQRRLPLPPFSFYRADAAASKALPCRPRFPDETLTPLTAVIVQARLGRRAFPARLCSRSEIHTVLEEVLGRCARISGADSCGLCPCRTSRKATRWNSWRALLALTFIADRNKMCCCATLRQLAK